MESNLCGMEDLFNLGLMLYEYEPHSICKIKGLSWSVCNKCGLVYLRNSFTQWAIRYGCNNEDHKDYERMRCFNNGR